MAITRDQFKGIVALIEDGEIDDFIVELQTAIDERNERRKDDILRLVRSAWGEGAAVVVGGRQESANTFIRKAQREGRAPVDYVPDVGPQLPAGYQDPMGGGRLPTPIESQGIGGGGGAVAASPQAIYSPVSDPLASGGGDPYGDNDPNIVSTGAQIG